VFGVVNIILLIVLFGLMILSGSSLLSDGSQSNIHPDESPSGLDDDPSLGPVSGAKRFDDSRLIYNEVLPSTTEADYVGGGEPEYFPEQKNRSRVYYFFESEDRGEETGRIISKRVGFGYAPVSNVTQFKQGRCFPVVTTADIPWSSSNLTGIIDVVYNPTTEKFYMPTYVGVNSGQAIALFESNGSFCDWSLHQSSKDDPWVENADFPDLVAEDSKNRFTMIYEDTTNSRREVANLARIPYGNMSDVTVIRDPIGFPDHGTDNPAGPDYEGEASICKDQSGTYHVFYNTRPTILHLKTENFTHFRYDPFNPIFSPSENGWDDKEVRTFDPLYTRINGQWIFTYAGADPGNSGFFNVGIGYTETDPCGLYRK
jgi:hypothetical protein